MLKQIFCVSDLASYVTHAVKINLFLEACPLVVISVAELLQVLEDKLGLVIQTHI